MGGLALQTKALAKREVLEESLKAASLSWEEAAQFFAMHPRASLTKLANMTGIDKAVIQALRVHKDFRKVLSSYLVNAAYGVEDEIETMEILTKRATDSGQSTASLLNAAEFLKKQGGTYAGEKKELDTSGRVEVVFSLDGGGTPELGANEFWSAPTPMAGVHGPSDEGEGIVEVDYRILEDQKNEVSGKDRLPRRFVPKDEET